jgi:CCR4-NOT transcription complex subunit 7/8
MKWNVDLLKIIQLGIKHDHHNEESIGLLERLGIDLKKNREKGIDSSDFGRLILSSGLVSNNSWCL